MWGFIFIAAFLVILNIINKKSKPERYWAYTKACADPEIDETDLLIDGRQMGLSNEALHEMLVKRCNYYNKLLPSLQERFIQRLVAFMNERFFIIKAEKGVKEMPVLTSAAAIQLTFGLKDYLLYFYKYVRIYPEEYVSDHFSILAGNVEDNIITVAWTEFLKGNENNLDGSNVGLHEMSHALYNQKMIIEADFAPDFAGRYQKLEVQCKEAFVEEQEGKFDLYSEYANTNIQEFWAESVEVFFEKPDELNRDYPEVFDAMKVLLNQDPRNSSEPIIKSQVSFPNKLSRVKELFSNSFK